MYHTSNFDVLTGAQNVSGPGFDVWELIDQHIPGSHVTPCLSDMTVTNTEAVMSYLHLLMEGV
jgi:hypothetical protein